MKRHPDITRRGHLDDLKDEELISALADGRAEVVEPRPSVKRGATVMMIACQMVMAAMFFYALGTGNYVGAALCYAIGCVTHADVAWDRAISVPMFLLWPVTFVAIVRRTLFLSLWVDDSWPT